MTHSIVIKWLNINQAELSSENGHPLICAAASISFSQKPTPASRHSGTPSANALTHSLTPGNTRIPWHYRDPATHCSTSLNSLSAPSPSPLPSPSTIPVYSKPLIHNGVSIERPWNTGQYLLHPRHSPRPSIPAAAE